jgi:CDP-diacylglycerol--glycerol-3-phosphate 3-phosphatidyltransferase
MAGLPELPNVLNLPNLSNLPNLIEHWFRGTPLARMSWIDLVPLLGLPAFWITSFLIYLLRCALFGMERTPRIDQVTRTPWLPRIIMEFGYWMFRIPVRMCIALGITANMITVGSLVLTVIAAAAISQGHFAFGGWTLLFAFTCDSWDGIVARATGTVSVTGEFFDSTIDRYNDLITFFGFMYYYRNDRWPLLVVLTAMVGSTLVSYTRAKGVAVGVDPNVGYMQRHERAVWIGVATALAPILSAFIEGDTPHPVYHLVVVVLVLVAIMTNITAIWRIRYVMDGLRRLGSNAPHGAMK